MNRRDDGPNGKLRGHGQPQPALNKAKRDRQQAPRQLGAQYKATTDALQLVGSMTRTERNAALVAAGMRTEKDFGVSRWKGIPLLGQAGLVVTALRVLVRGTKLAKARRV